MTVETDAVNTLLQGNGATTEWDWEFNIPSADDMEVYLVDNSTGERTLLTYGADFSATGFNDEAGGTVTYPLVGDPIETGMAIFIQRVVPYTQLTDIDPNDGFNPEVMETALDRIVMQVQQIADGSNRAIKTAPGTDGLEAAVELEEGDLLMVGPDNTLVPGPNAGDIQDIIDIADDIADIIAGSPIVAGRYMALAYEPVGEDDVLFCDGSAVSRTTYSLLFDKIGEMYGAGDGVSTFNLPDMRGRFMRGFADGESTDPDRASRTDRGDGTTGDAVGTKQAGAYLSHTHTGTTSSDGAHTHDPAADPDQQFLITQEYGGTENVDAGGTGASALTGEITINVADNTLTGGAHTHTFTSAASGGNETRPTNISVYICITTGLAPA